MTVRASKLRSLFARPRIFLPLFAVGALLFFPRAVPHEITMHHRVPASCPATLVVEIDKGGTAIRRFQQLLGKEQEITHTMKLPDVSLTANLWLECDDGRATPTRAQPIVIDRSGRIDFDLSAECPCADVGTSTVPAR